MGGRTAVVTGITGQDGAHLARLLRGRGYRVVGVHREPTSFWRLEALEVRDIELTTSPDLADLRPDEFYHLAAQTQVGLSYDQPVATMEANATATAQWLDALRKDSPETRFLYASTASIFGQPQTSPQDERTPIAPTTPYGASKAAGHWLTTNFRDAFGMHASCAILFNHESRLRSAESVTRRIVNGIADVAQGRKPALQIGNPGGQRDWGDAEDFVEAMWRMLQAESPADYVVATGKLHSVRDFIEVAADFHGLKLEWQGDEAVDPQTGRTVVQPDPTFFRPTEAAALVGDPTRIRERLGWVPRISFEEMVRRMASGPAG